tara:strand:+ start:5317 stop:8073 length:2757 start_codon:yes stop_codon:yes gene_type:complete
MLLKNLINNLPKEIKSIKVKGLAINSKKVKTGYVFFAINGSKQNGEKYITEAIKKKAIAIVCSKKCKYYSKNVPVIKSSNIRSLLSEVCSKFYKSKPKNIIAVTGTNGKTSVTDLFYQILKLHNKPVASIGTLGVKFNGKFIKTKLTSPDTISLHQILEKIKKNKIDNVIIEASSHGLHQNRIDHLNLKAGIFTNFSQDHLDYHKNMSAYLNAKLLLFRKVLTKKKVLICDKDTKQYSILKNISKKRLLRLIDITSIKTKLRKYDNFKMDEIKIKNLSMAISAAKLCNLKEEQIFKSLNRIRDTNGRIELVKVFPNNVKVFVDFAHTPDALKRVLEVLKRSVSKNIVLVFGCGGERDAKKRPLMATIAGKNCKKIYVTDDNPRKEKPEDIRRELIKKLNNTKHFNIGNRAKAIKSAILNADPNDIILIAGKGHETEQIYKNKTINISDKEIVRKIKIKKIPKKKRNFIQNKIILKKIVGKLESKNFHGLSIDSRNIKKENIFITIKGKKNDGNRFIPKAIKKGAQYIVTSKKFKGYKNKIIKISNEISFLNKYAKLKRDYSTAKIIAITGSAGKTSLKNLIKDLLQNFGDTIASPKSYNNHFGVPLSLSNLNTSHKFGVFEIGMSKKGEINRLSKIVRPHIAIITNIGEAHIENFKNLNGIAEAKGEIINNISNGGTVILNRDDKYFQYFSKKAKLKKIRIISFGINKNSDVSLIKSSRNKSYTKLIVNLNNRIISIKAKNINIYNILSSLALLKELKINLNKASKLFKYSQPSEGRGKIYKIKRYKKNFRLIDESYNANPLSMKSAIKNFSSIKKRDFKKYLILGDMLELGKKSEAFHKNLSKVINNSDIDKVFVKGNKSLITYKNVNKSKRGNIFQHDEDVDFTLNDIIANNDYLMIKGSNATGLNNLSKKIIKGN